MARWFDNGTKHDKAFILFLNAGMFFSLLLTAGVN